MRISGKNLKLIYTHASEIYPHECFGFLVGVREGGGLVRRAVRGANVSGERSHRFEMASEEFLAVEAAAEREGMEVIGFYHSHPDWPAMPSQQDLKTAWSSSFYLIVSVHDWHPLNVTIWRLADGAPGRFEQVPVEVVDDEEQSD
jgi:proteasome lid subunit RPN8/RPN11